MASALPARKVAGNKSGPVRRSMPARSKPPKEEYTNALRARCHKDSLVRKPEDLHVCPHCGGVGTVMTRVAYTKKYAAKWFRKCNNRVVNVQGKEVGCTYFNVPEQPPVPAAQLAGIEAQRTADNAERATVKAKRESEKAQREALAHPENAELQLKAEDAARVAAIAEADLQAALDALREGDKTGWVKNRKKTPPPQASSSRVTLDLVNQASGSSSRTSTSQAQLDHDREVALAMQRTWDAETNTSPESIHTAKSLAPQETSGATSGAVKTTQPPMPAGRNSDPSNRMRHAARLQQQAADWLGERGDMPYNNTKLEVSSSSSPVVTPTPAPRGRSLRPFPLDFTSTGNKATVDKSHPARADLAEYDDNFMMNIQKKTAPRGTETPPPSTQPRTHPDAVRKRRRASSTSVGSPPPSTQPRPPVKSQTLRRRSPSLDSVISISSDDTPPPPRKRQRAEDHARVKQEAEEAVIDVGGRSHKGKQADTRESPRTSVPSRRPLPKPVRAPKTSPKVSGKRLAAEPTTPLVHPPSDPPSPSAQDDNVEDPEDVRGRVRHSPTRESTLESSNKENHDAGPAAHDFCTPCPPTEPPSGAKQEYEENAGAPPELEQYGVAPLSPYTTGRAHPSRTGKVTRRVADARPSPYSRRAPRSLPNEVTIGSAQSRTSRGVLVEQNIADKAPWDSSDEGASPTASQPRADEGDTLAGEHDLEGGSDGELNGSREADALRSDGGEDDVGSVDATESSDEQDFLDGEGPSRIVEPSVAAAVHRPWTHDLEEVEAWYCTVFLWIVTNARPREVLLSMNTGETEVQLSDRPSIYTALAGIRVRTWLVWDFASSVWIEQDFTASLSVSEFDQHTILIKLPDVTRCVEFGRAMAHAQEPLWPALNNTQDDAPREYDGDEDDRGDRAEAAHDVEVATVIPASKPSRKGKEVVRT